MRTLVRRQVLVACLTLVAGAAAAGLAVHDDGLPPPLPPVSTLVAAGGWQTESASAPVVLGVRYQQWLLQDRGGDEALLYLGVTSRVQTMLEWSGELGYQGAGYVVRSERDASLRLADGRSVPVGAATMQHVADRRVLRFAVVGPGGVGRRGRDLALRAALDLARGQAATYYLVRVAVLDVAGADALADGALATVLSRLDPA